MRMTAAKFDWGWLFEVRCWRCGCSEQKSATSPDPIVIDGREQSREDLEQLAERLLRERGWVSGPKGGSVCRRCERKRTGG